MIGGGGWEAPSFEDELEKLIAEGKVCSPVLDVGCGRGDISIALAQRGFAVMGIDENEDQLEVARKRAEDFGLSIEFIKADAFDLGSIGRSFGTVFLGMVLRHIHRSDNGAARFESSLASTVAPGTRLHVFDTEVLQASGWSDDGSRMLRYASSNTNPSIIRRRSYVR